MSDLTPDLPADAPRATLFEPAARAAVRAAITQYEAGDVRSAYVAALPWAEQGDHDAQRLVGNVPSMGALGMVDLVAAQQWWERSALSGDAAAQFNLGLSYLDPKATETDPTRARAWLAEAAQGGHVGAMARLGESLLSDAADDLARAAEGYAWLQIASRPGRLGARMALGRALQASRWDDAARLPALQREALSYTAPYRGTVGADLLGHADRDAAGAYFVTLELYHLAGMQGLIENAFAANPSKPSSATLFDMARKASVEIETAAELGTLPPDATVWTLLRRGIAFDDVEVVHLAATRLWELVRPGDSVDISDGVNAHVTFVWSIDREADCIRFLDVWPDQFLLLAGQNALGIEARVEPYGRTRKLLCVTRDDFLQAVRGLVGLVGLASIQTLWQAVPELATDSQAAVALAATLARSSDTEACSRGLGWLIALLRGQGPPLTPQQAGAIADRAWLAAERLHFEHPNRRIRCGAPGTKGPTARAGTLLDELARSHPPRFDMLPPQMLAAAVSRRAASAVATTKDPSRRTWWRSRRPRPPTDPLQRPDRIGAEAILEQGLQRYPNNDRLRLLHATLLLSRGDAEAAALELAELIQTLDAKRQESGPLVHDLDGIEVGVASERSTFASVAAQALELRAQALMALDRPEEAINALQDALTRLEHEEPSLLERLAEAAAVAGDTELAQATQARLNEVRAQKIFSRVLGGRP